MSDWMIWFIIAAVLVILEMATGTLYLLMLGIGVAAGGVAALFGAGPNAQMLVAAVAGSAAVLALRKSSFGKLRRSAANRDPNVNLDIGQSVAVQEWATIPDGVCTARAMYRGALWNIELASGSVARPGAFTICEVRGNRLIVANSTDNGADH